MAKRKKRELPPHGSQPTREAPKQRIDSLDPPNHLPITLDNPALLKIFIKEREAWGAFVALRHAKAGSLWQDCPSWLDAQVFADMLLKHEPARELAATMAASGELDGIPVLAKIVQQVFEDQYLPWLFQRFDGPRRGLLARWLVGHLAAGGDESSAGDKAD